MELAEAIGSAWSIIFDDQVITCLINNHDSVEYNNGMLGEITTELSKISGKNLLFAYVVLQNYVDLFNFNHIISIINCNFTGFTGNLDNIHDIDVFDYYNTLDYISSHDFKNLVELSLNNFGFEIFPDWLNNFTKLYKLNLRCNLLSDIPESIVKFTNLKALSINHNKFTEIPSILQYLNLENLDISSNNITVIPDFIKGMKLQHLYASITQIKIIPNGLDHISIWCTTTPLHKKLIEYKGNALYYSDDLRKFSKLLHVANYTITYLAMVHNVPLDVINLVARSALRA